jgi:D-alanyl-D-alanine carboxypeptidase
VEARLPSLERSVAPTPLIGLVVALLVGVAGQAPWSPQAAPAAALSEVDGPSGATPGPELPTEPTATPVAPRAPLADAPSPVPTPHHVSAGPSLPECRYLDEAAQPGPGGDWTLAVVDSVFRLPPGYAPPDLVPVSRAGVNGSGRVRASVVADLEAMVKRAHAQGIALAVRSAYRSEARQRTVFAGWVRSSGRPAALRSSARPGHSEHQLGTTIDFSADGGAPWIGDFSRSRSGRWLAAHGPEYGFVPSYPDGAFDRTCYAAEPWHFRWVGREHAAAATASGLTLREWLWSVSVDRTVGRGHARSVG